MKDISEVIHMTVWLDIRNNGHFTSVLNEEPAKVHTDVGKFVRDRMLEYKEIIWATAGAIESEMQK